LSRKGAKKNRRYSGPDLTGGLGIGPGSRLTLAPRALLDSGEAFAEFQGAPVHVAGGLPGEEAEVEVVKVFPERVAARFVTAAAPPADRVAAPCPYYLECSGCQLQHMSYGRQLEFKRQRVASELEKWPELSGAAVEPAKPSPAVFGYRNHARFTVKKGGPQAGEAGFVNMTTRRFLKVDRCLLMEEQINSTLAALQGRLQGMSQVSVRSSADGALVQPKLTFAGAPPSGQRHAHINAAGRRFKVAASSFFQVNTGQMENLVALLVERLRLSGNETLVDAYCGVGAFAALLAPYAGRVVGIEDSASAVQDARENAAGLENVTFVEGKAEVELAKVEGKIDAVVLDPPRAGCHPETLAAVVARRPSRIALVSCEPTAMARDLALLSRGRFILESVHPFDMFPQTRHVEAVAFLKAAD
jgi:23S rRNA (uracil1939-C5)-methyltransferase